MSTRQRTPKKSKMITSGLLALTLSTVAAVGGWQSATAAPGDSVLGTSDSFVVLAGAGVTNTGPTTLSGDLGTFPNPAVTGSDSITFASGVNQAGNAVSQGAKDDLVTAYDRLMAAGPPSSISADLAGSNLKAGVYNSASSLGLSGELVLDAEGDPDAIFVFQAGSSLTTASSSSVSLVNGAQACNVFWVVGSSATLGTDSDFTGSLVALASVSLQTGATVEGRVLARNGAVTLDSNVITAPECATATEETIVPGPTVTPTPNPTDEETTPVPEEEETTEPPVTPGTTPPRDGQNPPSDTPPVTPPGDITPPSDTPSNDVPSPPSDGSQPPEDQVPVIPEGPVATGDGSSLSSNNGNHAYSGAFLLVAISALMLTRQKFAHASR
jgi:Ice-binding-like